MTEIRACGLCLRDVCLRKPQAADQGIFDQEPPYHRTTCLPGRTESSHVPPGQSPMRSLSFCRQNGDVRIHRTWKTGAGAAREHSYSIASALSNFEQTKTHKSF